MADPISFAITVAMTGLQMAMQASKVTYGPRLQDTKFASGEYGVPWGRFWGTCWQPCPYIMGSDLVGVERERKTKGGKYNNVTYYADFAVAIACHPIDKVLKIKADGHLILDYTGVGPVTPFDFGEAGNVEDYITIHLGTDDQMPPDRMRELVEAKNGAGSCPGYRGKSFVGFWRFPVEKFGNRVPQIQVLATKNAVPHYPYEERPGLGPSSLILAFSADFAVLYMADIGAFGPVQYAAADTAARAQMISGALPADTRVLDVDAESSLWAVGPGLAPGNYLLTFPADGIGSGFIEAGPLTWAGFSTDASDLFAFDYNGRPFIGVAPIIGRANLLYFDKGGAGLVSINSVDTTGISFAPNYWAQDTDGEIWAGGVEQGGVSTNKFNLFSPTSGRSMIVTMPSNITAGGVRTVPFRHFSDASHDHFLVAWNGEIVLVDRASGTVIDHVSYSDDAYRAFKECRPSDSSWYQHDSTITFREVSAIDGTLVRVFNLSSWKSGASHQTGLFEPITRAWIGFNGGDATWYFLDRSTGETVVWGDVVADVCELAGLASSAYDTSLATMDFASFKAGNGSGKDWLQPGNDLFDIDAVTHGFKLKLLPRTGVADAVISSASFAAPESEDASLFEATRNGSTDLPITLTLQFSDKDADGQPIPAMSGPLSLRDAKGTQQVDASNFTFGVDDAQQIVARMHRRMQFDAKPIDAPLTAAYIALEPGAVKVLNLEGLAVTARLDRMEIGADRRIAAEWKRDDVSVGDLNGLVGAPFDGREDSEIPFRGIAKGFVLDVPLLIDADNSANPIIYVAAGPYSSSVSFTGAAIYQAIDGEYSDQIRSVTAAQAVTWGVVTDVLPWANPNVWDRGTEIDVAMQNGTLTGATEAACNADPRLNRVAIGRSGRWEILQFTVAELTGPGDYTLSGFLRGRRGSEWAAELHEASDYIVLLDNAFDTEMGLSEVGTDLAFKAITNGRSAAGAFPIYVAPYTGASLKPYAPCNMKAIKDPATGDWALSWDRRARLGAAWTSGTPIPLGEASEAYQLTVGDGVSSDLKTVSSATTYVWDVAEQTADTGGEVMVGNLAWSVAQVSDAVGAGYLSEATA